MRFSKATLGTALILGAVVAAGCAEERDVRNTVQPNIVRKTDLVGSWYYKPTVLDVPYGSATTFIGEQAMDLEKIVWDVQEDILYARRAFEQVKNTDNSNGLLNNTSGKFLGQPVGAWRIQSHFDIIRDYNSSTGEETNTVRETGERPWYEREFIRVDWSANLADNWGFMVDKVAMAPINYYVTDPTSPEALRFERRQVPGQANPEVTEVGYIDVTNKLFVSPETVYYEGYGYIPACWFVGNADDCTAQEIKLRHSFLKLDPTRQYEPQIWTDKDQERFGYFDVERKTYSRQYGVTDSGRVKMARRFNIWVDHYQTNADGTYVLDADGNKVRKPESERTARQLTYWANEVYPTELKTDGAEIVKGWSDAMANVVQYYADQNGGAMNIKLMDGTTVPFDRATTPMILWCGDNPTVESSPAGCKAQAGGVGKVVREGDLRYNMIAWVDKPQRGGPLGYGPMPADPETGETIHASSYIYGAGLDTYATWSRDIVLLLNKEITVADFTGGANVRNEVTANFEGHRGLTAREPNAGEEALSHMNFSWAKHSNGVEVNPASFPKGAKEWNVALKEASKRVMDSGVLGPGFDRGPATLAKIQGTELENIMLQDPEMRMLAAPVYARHGMNPFVDILNLPAEVRRQASPLTILSSASRKMNHDLMVLQAKRAMCMADFGEESALGLAKEFKTSYDLKTAEGKAMAWAELRKRIYRGVTEHEMGHNVGLRHNFEGSIDSMNYNKAYWDLRIAANGGNKATLKARYDQNPTTAELDGKITEYQYSTVMDYGAKFNSDVHGLGKYDNASIKYAYGDLLEVFTDQRNDGKVLDIADFQTYGWPTAIDQEGANLIAINYTQFPNLVDLEARADVPTSSIRTDAAGNLGNQEKESPRRVAVPYRFCSDEFAGSTVTCARFDEGADVYEIGRDYVSRYKNYYIFNNFKRDRWGWEGQGYENRIIGRYFDPIQSQMKSMVRYRASLEDQVGVAPVAFLFADSKGWKGWTLAVQDGFNLFGDVMTQPDAGSFSNTTDALGVQYLVQTSDSMGRGIANIPLIDGRYFSTTWDFDSGYYWFERQTRVGNAIDKIITTYMMAEASANYMGADTFADIRQYAINYYTIYGEQLRNTFAFAQTENLPYIAPELTTAGTLVQPRWDAMMGTMTPRTVRFVDPALSFTVRYAYQLYGMAMFRATFDNSFVDYGRIYVDGNGEQINLPGGERKVWADPVSGKTYVAWQPTSAAANKGLTGARMLQYAQDVYARYTAAAPADKANLLAQYNYFIQQMDLQRAMATAFDHSNF